MGARALNAIATLLVVLFCSAEVRAQRFREEDLPAVMERLESEDANVRAEAVDVLGRRAFRYRERFTDALRMHIRSDPDWRVRASAGRAAGRLALRAAVPELIGALADPSVDVRVVAAAALWRLPAPEAVPALIRLLEDRDAVARQWGALALGVAGDARAVLPLVQLLDDPEADVRLDAIRSLGRVRDRRALGSLRVVAREDERTDAERLEAISSIAALDGAEKLAALVELAEHPRDDIAVRAVEALAQVGTGAVVPALRRLRRQTTRARHEAIDAALREIEGRENDSEEQEGEPRREAL